MNDVVPLAAALEQLCAAKVTCRRRDLDLRLRRLAPKLVLLQALLGLADRRQIQIEALPIDVTELVVDRFHLAADVVEDALPIAEATQLAGFLVRSPANEE